MEFLMMMRNNSATIRPAGYSPLSIILYGSYANGTNNLNSDFDALVISHHHEEFHDTSFVNGIRGFPPSILMFF
mgnify:CR=1 FL=1